MESRACMSLILRLSCDLMNAKLPIKMKLLGLFSFFQLSSRKEYSLLVVLTFNCVRPFQLIRRSLKFDLMVAQRFR